MPIYVFHCDSCGEEFERLQKMSAADPDVCPHCGKRHHVHRQVTAPVFRLAGKGWYETDFKSAGEKKHNLVDGGSTPQGTATPASAKTGKPKATASAGD